MAKHRVIGLVTMSMSTLVEADSKEEAIEIARERDVCDLLSPERMGQTDEEYWVHSGEIDGEVHEFQVQED